MFKFNLLIPDFLTNLDPRGMSCELFSIKHNYRKCFVKTLM